MKEKGKSGTYSEAKWFYLQHLKQKTGNKKNVNMVQYILNDIFINTPVFILYW
jgi:hypothetical protein